LRSNSSSVANAVRCYFSHATKLSIDDQSPWWRHVS
jgi:hypothetical protein